MALPRLDISYDFVDSQNTREIGRLADFLLTHPGDYGQAHKRWVLKTCIPAIESGDRHALVVTRFDMVVGDCVMVPRDDGVVEWKNFRFQDRELEGRGLARALLGLAEFGSEHISNGTNTVVTLDTRTGSQAESFFARHGFKVERIEGPDTYMSKCISPTTLE